MIAPWVNKKTIDMNNINKKIERCIETRYFTNGGKNVNDLQENIKNIFFIDKIKEVLMVCNGAMGINALIGGMNIYYGKQLKWIVPAFTFPCATQGALINSIVFDIDENMGPSLLLMEENINNFDGVFITNCFGCVSNIELYEVFCKKHNKLLLFDNAASPMSYYKNKNILNYGDGCVVSLHHTKAIGFGEGGFIVFNKKYHDVMKKTICFGYTETNKKEYDINASNYKMSEIACIYIDDYLTNLQYIYICIIPK
jgi:dTDP-4-amino-4,6-dideoxygalactose transaminase